MASAAFFSVMSWNFADRARAAGIHLLVSAAVAAVVATLVFLVWYPYPYRELAGGRELFFLVMSVDLVMGPLLTFAVFDRKKGWPHLRRDLAVIGLLQLAALAYGVYVVSLARPVYLVYEVDRYRAVTASDIDPALLADAPPAYRNLPWTGPVLIGVAKPSEEKAFFESLRLQGSGVELGMQPKLWQPYDTVRATAKTHLVRLSQFIEKVGKDSPAAQRLRAAAAETGYPESNLFVLPLVSRTKFWTALTDGEGNPVGWADVDMF